MKLRKLLAAALSLTMMCSAATTFSYAPVTAYAANAVAEEPEEPTEDETVTYPIEAEVDGCKYSVYEDHAVFSKCPNIKGDFVVPAEVNGVPVTKIEERAFSGQSEIVSVTFPATVTEIGGHLAGYTHIEKYLVDGNSNTFCSVDGVIFTKDMKKLVAYPTSYNTKTYTVPDGVEIIGDGSAYTSDIESLILPDSVTEVESFAYTYCKQLKSITLSKNLKSIGYSGFGNCASLESADVPASVEKLGTSAFGNCSAMKTLTINNPNCKIADFKPNDDVVVRGYEGSTAQTYAEKNSFTFEVLSGEAPIAVTTTATASTTITTLPATTTTSASTTIAATTQDVASTTSTAAGQSAETMNLKYSTFSPINKVIGGKPYEVRLAGLYSVSGAKVLDESVDAGKVADLKSGVIASVTRAAQDVDFTDSAPTQAAAIPFIQEKAISWFNDNYAALTGYTLTALSINSFTVTEQAASVVTSTTTAPETTAATTTATIATAAASTASDSSSTSAATTAASTTAADSTTAASTTSAVTTSAEISTTPASISEAVVGKWKFSSFTDESGNPSDKFSNTSSELTLNADGTGKYTVVSTEVTPEDGTTFTWTADGDTVTAILDNAETEANMLFFTFTDGELTFEREDGVIHFSRADGSASKLGDVNGDGKVDAKDASNILAEYARLSTGVDPTYSEVQKKAADVNGDGNTDAKDASAILAYYAYLSIGGTDDLETYLTHKA